MSMIWKLNWLKLLPKTFLVFCSKPTPFSVTFPNHIFDERNRPIQLQILASEYEQTFKVFIHTIVLVDKIVEGLIVHLSGTTQQWGLKTWQVHCQSNSLSCYARDLGENIDAETRLNHAELYKDLYNRATMLLEKASERWLQIVQVGSCETVLDKGIKEKLQWVPDLTAVTSPMTNIPLCINL